MAKLIVHATDFSPASQAAFRHALAAAKRDRARLVLVHVLEPILLGDEEYMERELAFRDAAVIAARRRMNRLLAAAKSAGVTASSALLEGDPSRQIVELARKQHARLIALGTHGRTGLRRLFLGSVAARVAVAAPCPVLTVHGAGFGRRHPSRRVRSPR